MKRRRHLLLLDSKCGTSSIRALAALAIGSVVLLTGPAPAYAADSPPPYCQANAEHDQFDFWVGEWNVYVGDDAARQLVGENSISRQANGCVIRESWLNSGGGDGYSLRYYNPLRAEWRMLWVSSGYSVETTGHEIAPGVIQLVGSIDYFATGTTQGFRVRFTANDDGTVRQFAEQQDAESGEWSTWFDGTYVRKPVE